MIARREEVCAKKTSLDPRNESAKVVPIARNRAAELFLRPPCAEPDWPSLRHSQGNPKMTMIVDG